ncbi:PrpF protein-domain-containing protein [Massariosphaeria phaeospora]|uniref:PrpF protein-domain-containing protein n=1 Tax=Massariosphaeria phaeospora TaxID=100035 RepID=A0A7C8M1R7_9PLEO|nr:PrpF protein-domain-containing protein [Massariosphaeria phaeospora]
MRVAPRLLLRYRPLASDLTFKNNPNSTNSTWCRGSVRGIASRSAQSQIPLYATYYRGGTSRAVILQPQGLPADRKRWPAIFRQLIGSLDSYGSQLGGLGAGTSIPSKLCLVEGFHKPQDQLLKAGKTEEDDIDVDYTLVGLGIGKDEVEVASNCGSMSSAIGPYAYNAGLLPETAYGRGDGEVTVKIRNTNTGKIVHSTFNVTGDQASVLGPYTMDGVAGTGSKIQLEFKDPYGSKTGQLLPTGKRIDHIAGYNVTCVDGPNPVIFIRADELKIDGTILPNELNKRAKKLVLLESIRRAAAVRMRLANPEDMVPRTIPEIGIISMSSTHTVLSGATIKSSQVDLVVRFISATQPHHAAPLTAAVTTAIAARIPGTVVEQLLAPDLVDDSAITIGHASGRLKVNVTMGRSYPVRPTSATVYSTARRIFEGNMFWNDEQQPTDEQEHNVLSGTQKIPKRSLGLAFVLESRGLDPSAPILPLRHYLSRPLPRRQRFRTIRIRLGGEEDAEDE